ncbi:MAG TPA: phosphatase PAP2 family protein [Anaerolineae bacterium]|nr:phosphatase PAP2 family protein [Anaerolineae bacterium]
MVNKILQADAAISKKIRIPQEARFWRTLAAFFAHSGDSWFWLSGLFFVWLLNRGEWHTHAALLAAAIFIQAVLVLSIKFTVRRSRPAGEWGAIYRNTDPHSFPSGHAVRAIMLAVMCWGLGLKPLATVLTLWVPLVSLARVMLGVHYLIDVVAGWILGIFIGLGILAIQPLLFSIFPFNLFLSMHLLSD